MTELTADKLEIITRTMNSIVIACIIVIIAITVIILSIIIYMHSSTDKTRELALLQLQLSLNIDPGIVEKLDNFISECFNDYILLNTEYRQDLYWTEAEEKKMVTEVANIVSDRLSPYMFKQLSTYYNEKAIPDVIGNKIYELTIAYFNTKTNKAPEDDNMKGRG